jgi:hypothetical protein
VGPVWAGVENLASHRDLHPEPSSPWRVAILIMELMPHKHMFPTIGHTAFKRLNGGQVASSSGRETRHDSIVRRRELRNVFWDNGHQTLF